MRTPICLVVALTAATPLFGQDPRALPPLAANVDVKVINVDVSVIDGNGKPITDLTSNDFEILEDDQTQKITNFLSWNRPAPSAAESRSTPEFQFRRRMILLVDNNYIDKSDRDSALRKLDEFMDQSFDGTYEWALGMISQQLEIVQPFTADKTTIHAAVAKLRKTATSSFRDVMDRSMFDDQLYDRGQLDAAASFASRERTNRNERSLTNTVHGLVDAAHYFATTPGRKMAVLLTGSMDLSTSFAAFERSSDRELQDSKLAISKLIDMVVREANAANMSIHVISAAGSRSAAPQHDIENRASGLGFNAQRIDRSSDTANTSVTYTLAAGTGGLLLTSNAVRQSFDAVDATSSSVYLLGYAPSHGEDRQYHRITVHLKRPGLRVVHRQGYLDLPADERLERLLRMRISILQPAASVLVTLNVSDLKVEGKPAVAILSTIPMSKITLLPRDGRYVGRVHVYLSIFDASGNNVGFHHRVQDLALSEMERQQASSDAFRYKMNVRLDRGEFTIALTMRDDLSYEVGTAVQKVRF